jgi:hypothetical protein
LCTTCRRHTVVAHCMAGAKCAPICIQTWRETAGQRRHHVHGNRGRRNGNSRDFVGHHTQGCTRYRYCAMCSQQQVYLHYRFTHPTASTLCATGNYFSNAHTYTRTHVMGARASPPTPVQISIDFLGACRNNNRGIHHKCLACYTRILLIDIYLPASTLGS